VRDPRHRAAGARRREPARLPARAGNGAVHRGGVRLHEPHHRYRLRPGRSAYPRAGGIAMQQDANAAPLAAPEKRGAFITSFARRNKVAAFALIVLAVVIIASIAAPLLAPGDPVD